MLALVVNPQRPAGVALRRDYARPQSAGELVVRVHLAGICSTDLEIARGYMNFRGVLGHEFVGTVVEGDAARVGQRVVAEINCPCGKCELCGRGLPRHCRSRTVIGIADRDGAMAEFIRVPSENCHAVPEQVTDAQAVFAEPLAAAVHVLEEIRPEVDQRVLVLGTGKLGLLVAQVLAPRVEELTVVGRNPHTLSLCAKLGLLTQNAQEIPLAAAHDVVIDCTGSPEGLRMALGLARPRGTIILKSTYAGAAKLDLSGVVIHEIRVVGSRCGPFAPALELLRSGSVAVESMISRVFPLEEAERAFEAAALPENIKVLLQAA